MSDWECEGFLSGQLKCETRGCANFAVAACTLDAHPEPIRTYRCGLHLEVKDSLAIEFNERATAVVVGGLV